MTAICDKVLILWQNMPRGVICFKCIDPIPKGGPPAAPTTTYKVTKKELGIFHLDNLPIVIQHLDDRTDPYRGCQVAD